MIRPREEGVEYQINHAVVEGVDTWLVNHNAHGPNFEVGWLPVAEPLESFDQLHVLVPHNETVRLEGVDTYRDQIVLGYRKEAIPRVAVMPLEL